MNRLLKIKAIQLFFTVVIVVQASSVLAYDEITQRRISIGLRLFRTLLASDINLSQKISPEQQLKLLIITTGYSNESQSIADELFTVGRGAKKGKIHGIPVNISILNVEQLQHWQSSTVAGIFIADKLSEQQLKTVVNFGIAHHVIVYSPFEGDVEEGVSTGLAVGIRVLPFINLKALEKSQISIKTLILKVAKIYED